MPHAFVKILRAVYSRLCSCRWPWNCVSSPKVKIKRSGGRK